MFDYREMKLAVYCFETAMGALLVTVGVIVMRSATTAPAPVTYIVPAILFLAVGIFLLLFGFETYLLRDDPDIWR